MDDLLFLPENNVNNLQNNKEVKTSSGKSFGNKKEEKITME